MEIPADHPVFASAEIIKNEYDYTLRLHLKKTGGFYGWDAFYDDEGKLTFKFLHPAKLENDNSLAGTRIFIDVGHGGTDAGATGLSFANREAICNLRLANKLKEKLEALGATVIMSRTDDSTVNPPDKQDMLRTANADYCIAIHHDSAGASANGFEAYHFSPFSKTAADFIDTRMDNTNVFKQDWDVRFHYYFMARMTYCPVVLSENGFLTNAYDYNTTIEPTAVDKKAQAMCDGILDYFRSIQ